MKKILLFTLAIGIAVSVSAQVKKQVAHINGTTAKYAPVSKLDVPANQAPMIKSVQKNLNTTKTNNVITDIAIGTSGNAFGFYGNGRTYLWADDNIGAVTFGHRADVVPGSGYLQYDLSVDNGATWEVNIGAVYAPDGSSSFNARYPQSGIYNPSGNTNPDNAYFTYWAPTLEGSNMSWGGIGYGVHGLDSLHAPTQDVFSTTGGYYYAIPQAYHITQTGEVWAADWNDSLDATGYSYSLNDELQLAKGVWNAGTSKFDYTRSLITIPMTGSPSSPLQKYVADTKIAFAPDGQIGYIAMIGHDDYSFMPDSVYYPILYKTVDGGANWTGPIRVDIGSVADVQSIYGDTILYTTGFELDLAVDGNGNPYIVTEAGVAAGGWSIASGAGFFGIFTFYSTDGGTTWDGKLLEMAQTFRGTFAAGTANEIVSDNRPQLATNMDGTAMFFTWLDTDTLTFGSQDGNYYPDLHLRGFKVSDHVVLPDLTTSSNVTAGSTADGAAYMGSASYYVFDQGSDLYEVPMCYQAMDPTNSTVMVTYHYIKGATINLTVGIDEIDNAIASVSQNFPNPFSGSSVVTVDLTAKTDLSLSICNLVGQKVYETSKGTVSAGTYNFNIDGSKLSSGLYYYTVKAGDYSVTNKMIVE